ncbi:PAS domain-containing sensor histidine kinase [Kribbella sandramycini]|uniref:PAS domain-containing sensor histidine kinase n=1 Tax=Kribbella sandramycini TaxID=60450 RepID=A0A7Y4L4E9_9ACTN|nr:PAS domain-containing sensor histidine kinase [Kribbella sandramycini]
MNRKGLVAAALVVPPAACAALALARASFDNANAALVLAVVIVGVAAFGYRPAGLLAAASSAVWFDFFLTVPYHRLTINSRDDVETTILLVLIGVAVSELAIWGRRQQARASRHRGYLDGVLATSQAVAAGGSTQELIDQVSAQLTVVLRLDGARFVAGDNRTTAPRLNPDGTVTRGGRVLKVERDGLPTNAEIELPVQHAGRTRGRFLLTAATHISYPDLQQRQVAAALAGQLAHALAPQPH